MVLVKWVLDAMYEHGLGSCAQVHHAVGSAALVGDFRLHVKYAVLSLLPGYDQYAHHAA